MWLSSRGFRPGKPIGIYTTRNSCHPNRHDKHQAQGRATREALADLGSFTDESSVALGGGVKALLSTTNAFAATQAAWRFYNNERFELSELVVPLRDYAKEQIDQSEAPFVLRAHDWCKLRFPEHTVRKDVSELSNKTDIAYELTTLEAISANDGTPLAPFEMHMKTKDSFLSMRDPAPPAVTHLD